MPKAGIAILGIGAADPAALAQYQARVDAPSSYLDALHRVASGNLGRTLDGVSVSSALNTALKGSMQLFLVSWFVIALAITIAVLKPRPLTARTIIRSLGFFAFIPAYLPGFLLLSLSVIATSSVVFVESWTRDLALGLVIGVTPACFAVNVILKAYEVELTEPYVRVMRGYGYDDDRIFLKIRRAALLYSIPSWEKLVSFQLVVLIFTEAVFSYPGFGSLFLRAVQRTDTNVILAAVLYISAAIVITRGVSTMIVSFLDPRDQEAA